MLKFIQCKAVNTDPHGDDGFHRCYGCGEYPELSGPVAVKVNFSSTRRNDGNFLWGFCAGCVKAIWAAFEGGIKPTGD